MQPGHPHDEESIDAGEILRLGTIAEVDLAGGRVVVETGDVRTAPIRWSAGRAGATRIWSPPSVGEQVLLVCPGGDIEAAIALGSVLQDAFPPAGNSTRELIAFADGAQIAYDPEEGRLDVDLPAGGTINIVSQAGLTIDAGSAGVAITGPVTIDGNVSIDGDASISGRLAASDDVIGGGKSLKGHKHLGVTAGSAVSGLPQ